MNRVARQLTDGDESNGEADVIVAEYHEGAASNEDDATAKPTIESRRPPARCSRRSSTTPTRRST